MPRSSNLFLAGALLLSPAFCGCSYATPAPKNASAACRTGVRPPVPAPLDWPCWPEGMTPAEASFEVSNERDVPAKPAEVWTWLTHAELWPIWFSKATDVHFEHGGPVLEAGTVVVWKMIGSTIRVTIVRAEPPNFLAWEGGAKGVHAYHAWLIEPLGDGSHVVTVETERGSVPALFGWAYKNNLHDAHERWLEDLVTVTKSSSPPR